MPEKVKHTNDGKCKKCQEIFDQYPGAHPALRKWFTDLQAKSKDAHISTCGRGKAKQEQYKKEGKSNASWGKSAHNFGCAVDIFQMIVDKSGKVEAVYPRKWFNETVKPALTDWLKWYGSPGASFPELPHVEVANWRDLARDGKVKLEE
jgi:hypothetical protein